MEYTVDYFINKFENIPEEQWATHELTTSDGKHCTLGHCGAEIDDNEHYIHTNETSALILLFGGTSHKDNYVVYNINDYPDPLTTPKERILNKLYSIRDNLLIKS